MHLYLGVDFGTSGCRAALIDETGLLVSLHKAVFDPVIVALDTHRSQSPLHWWAVFCALMDDLAREGALRQVRAICVNGTSATLLAADAAGQPLGEALLYNDARAQSQAKRIHPFAPRDTAVTGATSSLAKRLYLAEHYPDTAHFLHQADWISGKLANRFNWSDENNSLKMGYDILTRSWPRWLEPLGLVPADFPIVVAPGTAIGRLDTPLAKRWGFAASTKIIAGTTDSTAAFLATGAHRVGEAVTCLGSTLVMKVLSDQPVFSPAHGVYSHRILGKWLVGGASNSGGNVLRHYFSQQQLDEMTPRLTEVIPTGLDYYPLVGIGERFPVQDANLTPRLSPRPASDVAFFAGILEGMTSIEKEAYRLLQALGAPYPSQILTTGGGSLNPAWLSLREAALAIPVQIAPQQEAAYGSALLAKTGAKQDD